jgi:protein phosphatase
MNARLLGVEVGVGTSRGRRKVNADAVLVDEAAGILAVADGMGDDDRAASVARLALDAVRERFGPPWSIRPPKERGADEAAERFVRGVVTANQRVHALGAPGKRGVGTTFAGVAVCADALCVAHVGDSRIYLVVGGTGTPARLSEDHTVLADMVLRKAMGAPCEALAHVRDGHALTRAIGMNPAVEVEPFRVRWGRGDVVVLCTDGVSDELDPAALGRALAGVEDVQQAAARVVGAAGEAGGWDNATVVIARHEHVDGLRILASEGLGRGG